MHKTISILNFMKVKYYYRITLETLKFTYIFLSEEVTIKEQSSAEVHIAFEKLYIQSQQNLIAFCPKFSGK